MATKIDLIDGPIPGENYTSDTKNYPWHRPPEFTDLDSAIEASFNKLATTEGAFSLLTALESGISIADMSSIFVINGVGEGKWTVDYAILLAGPIAHIMQIMADGYGIEYSTGWDETKKPVTSASYKKMKSIDSGPALREAIADAKEQVEEIKLEAAEQEEPTGFMSKMSKE
jgi:hypothetical protein